MLRNAPLRRTSRPARATQRQQLAAYALSDAASPRCCVACGSSQQLEHSHILSQARYPEYRCNPLNWVLLDRNCHNLWEHNKAGFAQQFPEAFAEKMRRMELVDAMAFEFFKMKNPTLFV